MPGFFPPKFFLPDMQVQPRIVYENTCTLVLFHKNWQAKNVDFKQQK